ncbi:cuticle protein 65-like [Teleopsis dalmanni]|uniref:cuticle protein 65-like n=1 Tax=Teleopsis dalmanni TaxID=139649 RepID=UPI0018CD1CEB|nr:cuticle protein 65-like [Teleopsis dalmanni]
MNRYFVAAYFAVILAVVNCSVYGGLGGYGVQPGGYSLSRNPAAVVAVTGPLSYAPVPHLRGLISPYGVAPYGVSRLGRPSAASAASSAAAASGNRGYGVPLGYSGLGSIY